MIYSHARLNLTKKKFLHCGGAQKEVKIHKNRDTNLAVRIGKLTHLPYMPHNVLLLKLRIYSLIQYSFTEG